MRAELGITNTPRLDDAQYCAAWLDVLNSDTKAIFTAASLATRAVDYIRSLQPAVPEPVTGEATSITHEARHNE